MGLPGPDNGWKNSVGWGESSGDIRGFIESVQTDGQRRIDLDINGLPIFIVRVPAETEMPESPDVPHLGLDHFGFQVANLDEVAAELKRRGAKFFIEPRTIRPGSRIAFVQGPENVRIELVERS